MSTNFPNEQHSIDMAEQIMTGGVIGQAPYRVYFTSTTLTNREAGIVDTYDPDVAVAPQRMALHWPAGHPHTSKEYEVISFPSTEEGNERNIQNFRDLILGASLGAAALARIPTEFRDMRRKFNDDTRHQPARALTVLCREIGAPVVGVSLDRIVASKSLPVGANVATLWHPVQLSPQRAIVFIQDAIKRAIAAEQP
jgi:hypothetical protein